jgi:hypothetical protein
MSKSMNKYSMYNPHYSLSVSDLSSIPKFQEAFATANTKAIESILFENGMEVTHGYEVNKRMHRNLKGSVVDCERFEGVERLDREWLQSGAASMEAYVASSDLETQKDMLRMSKQTPTASNTKVKSGENV